MKYLTGTNFVCTISDMSRVTMSRNTMEALRILGDSIRVARIKRGWSATELADRLGVSRATVISVEKAQPGVAVGTVLEAASLVGVPLFSSDPGHLASFAALKSAELALLPAAGRARRGEIDDDF